MIVHSSPKKFDFDKYSYLSFVLECCDFEFGAKEIKAMQKRLLEIINPELSKSHRNEAERLIAGLICETRSALIRDISELDCVKIELST